MSFSSSEPLISRLLPWLIPGLLGSTFTLIGVLVGILVGGEITLSCDRSPPAQCELTHANLVHHRSRSFSIDGLKKAEVESYRDSEGDYLYRVVMHTGQGVIPITNSYSSGLANYQSQADQINQFIETRSQPMLYLHQDDRWFGLIFMVIFGGAGVVILVGLAISPFLNKKNVEFD
ncbi:MAG TPA: hypothetical protein V6D29_18715 [Leptolyngbyaceae cyanobacterium]